MLIQVVNGLHCPHCLSPESHPTDEDKILIRGYKVQEDDGRWASHCMVCSGNYNEKLEWLNLPLNRDEGWFV